MRADDQGAFGVAVRARSLQRVVPGQPVPIADSALIEELEGVMGSPRLPRHSVRDVVELDVAAAGQWVLSVPRPRPGSSGPIASVRPMLRLDAR
jgi:hypothetical protein